MGGERQACRRSRTGLQGQHRRHPLRSRAGSRQAPPRGGRGRSCHGPPRHAAHQGPFSASSLSRGGLPGFARRRRRSGLHRVGFFSQARLGSRRKTHGSQIGDRRPQSLHPASHARKRLRVLLLRPRAIFFSYPAAPVILSEGSQLIHICAPEFERAAGPLGPQPCAQRASTPTLLLSLKAYSPLPAPPPLLWKTSLKYASVSFNPSSNPTLGSHFRMRLALVMSGQRRFGSSCGSGSNTIGGTSSKCLRMSSANSRMVISAGFPTLVGKNSVGIHSLSIPSIKKVG